MWSERKRIAAAFGGGLIMIISGIINGEHYEPIRHIIFDPSSAGALGRLASASPEIKDHLVWLIATTLVCAFGFWLMCKGFLRGQTLRDWR